MEVEGRMSGKWMGIKRGGEQDQNTLYAYTAWSMQSSEACHYTQWMYVNSIFVLIGRLVLKLFIQIQDELM